jgi:hypothetical protein
MERKSSGEVFIAGSENGHEFVTRLLPNGDRDPAFSNEAVGEGMSEVRALAIRDNGTVVIGGSTPVSGTAVMQLQADGELDILFGNGGTTAIELPTDRPAYAFVDSVAALADGRVMVGGGTASFFPHPFVARLLGDSGGDSPGVVGVAGEVVAQEDGQAVVTVRRTGGKTGAVSVGYRTAQDTQGISATAGEDYTEVSGRLTWADGDYEDQTITVDIPSNASPEEYETFLVSLEEPEGGVGLAARNAAVGIEADGGPYGQFALELASSPVAEPDTALVTVYRNYFTTGEVSVTVTPASGTATADEDFSAAPVTLTWADGNSEPMTVEIPITDDESEESAEDFSVSLSAPTGGAIVGPHDSISITISANDQPPPDRDDGGGGGVFDILSLLGLGSLVAALRRRARKR